MPKKNQSDAAERAGQAEPYYHRLGQNMVRRAKGRRRGAPESKDEVIDLPRGHGQDKKAA